MSSTSAPTTHNHPRALFALVVLTLINLFNYLDRYIVAGILPKIIDEFQITKYEAGWLGTVFIVVYMFMSPLGGYLGDNVPRRFVVAGSVALWCLATAGSSLAASFGVLLLFRAIIGVGEAGYGTVAPALISDLFRKERRTLMLSYFYVALPVGAAAGYSLGGYFARAHTWHGAFIAGGLPGLLLAALALFLPEPRRGAMDGVLEVKRVAFWDGVRELLPIRSFWFNAAGQTMMTFSIGGLAYWMPTFLEKERHLPEDISGYYFGAVTAVAGLLGTLAGGFLGARWEKKSRGALLRVSGLGLVAATPFMVLAANVSGTVLIFGSIFLAQFLIFFNTGPLNSALVNSVSPGQRAFAMGVNVLLIHLLGDAISPPIIGSIADHSSLARAIELNAIPLFVGGVILLVGARSLSRETAPSTARQSATTQAS